MTELQEKETIQKNLRIRLNQEISTNTRLTETNRSLSDQNRSIKVDFATQISHLKSDLLNFVFNFVNFPLTFRDDLDKEKTKCMDISRQLRNEQHCREQVEAALSVADERIKLIEQSNAELIKVFIFIIIIFHVLSYGTEVSTTDRLSTEGNRFVQC